MWISLAKWWLDDRRPIDDGRSRRLQGKPMLTHPPWGWTRPGPGPRSRDETRKAKRRRQRLAACVAHGYEDPLYRLNLQEMRCQLSKTTKTAPTLESLHRGANDCFRRMRAIQFKRGGTGKAIVTEHAVIFNTSTSSVVRANCTAISQLVFHTTLSSCCSLNGLLTALSRFQISLLYVRLNKTSAPRQVILGHQITISNSWPLRRRYYGVVSSTESLGSAIVPLRMKVEQRTGPLHIVESSIGISALCLSVCG